MRENARLKKIVAEQTMDLDVLKGSAEKMVDPEGQRKGRAVDSLRAWVLRAPRREGDRGSVRGCFLEKGIGAQTPSARCVFRTIMDWRRPVIKVCLRSTD